MKAIAQITIDIQGPQGNAYNLLGVAMDYSKKLGLDFDAVYDNMTAGDYESLVAVFKCYFGQYVTIEE